VLLLGSAVALVAVIGLFFWHYEYEIGLPDPVKLAMVSAATPICSSGDGERNFVPLMQSRLLSAMRSSPPKNPISTAVRQLIRTPN
jgi:hypothetical protein